ncbi:MAG: M20/M25/M40 family metallo-hydrolase [Bacteroidetes bacterium]|nr:M20/M25/M40 family metallo-hydrolase [Bacteroidota bacterium]
MIRTDVYTDAAQLSSALIDIPSITGQERAVLEFLETWLKGIGLPTQREHVEEDRWNLYAGWDEDAWNGVGQADVLFCTHVDTVPPFIPASRNGDVLSGRGACDTKGIMAAMLLAGRQLLQEGYNPAFLFVVGEETDSSGAKKAMTTGRTARSVIVGEPTDNMLATGHKGVLSYTLETHGVAVHSAYPERGSSAVHLLLDVLQEIRLADWGSNPLLGKATTNIGLIDGGIAMNTTAPSARATVMHRIVDDPASREEQLRHIVDGRAGITFHSKSYPQILHTVEGLQSKPVSFGTDIPYLRAMGPCLLFGPGSVFDAHTADEKILIPDIYQAIQSYIHLYHALRLR